jgi:hypothetical protein
MGTFIILKKKIREEILYETANILQSCNNHNSVTWHMNKQIVTRIGKNIQKHIYIHTKICVHIMQISL